MTSPGQVFLGTPLLKRGGDGKLKGKRSRRGIEWNRRTQRAFDRYMSEPVPYEESFVRTTVEPSGERAVW